MDRSYVNYIYRAVRGYLLPFPRFPSVEISASILDAKKAKVNPWLSSRYFELRELPRNKSILTHKVCGATKFIPPYAGGEGEKSFLDITGL